MKNTPHYSLVVARAHLLSRIWGERRNMLRYRSMEMQYRHVLHELTCTLIVIDATLGAHRSLVATESGRKHRDYVRRMGGAK